MNKETKATFRIVGLAAVVVTLATILTVSGVANSALARVGSGAKGLHGAQCVNADNNENSGQGHCDRCQFPINNEKQETHNQHIENLCA